MIYIKCGSELPDNSTFCLHCGTEQSVTSPPAPQPEQAPGTPTPVQKNVRRKNIPALIFAALSVLLAAALLLSFLNILPSPFGISEAASSSVFASQSFNTPEEAIESFIGYLKSGDYDGVLSTCAIYNISSKMDFQKIAEHLKVISPMQTNNLPSEYDQYITFNAYSSSAQLLNQIIKFKLYFTLSEENIGFINGNPIPFEDGQFPTELIDELNPSQTIPLNIIKIDKSAMHDSEEMRKILKESAAFYGAEDIQFRSVLYEIDGDYFAGGFTLIEFDGKWQIQNMSDMITTVTASGLPTPVSGKSEFEDMLG